MATDHFRTWIPIDCDEIQVSARASIRNITDELQCIATSSLGANDLCEHALLYAYLGLDTPSENWHEKSLDCLNLAIDRIHSGFSFHKGLYGGLAGIGWMIEHVFSILSGNEDGTRDWMESDALSEMDVHLLNLPAIEDSFGPVYDLLGGYVGIGVYWLERLPRKRAMLGIRQVLEALERIAEKKPEGVTWFTPPAMVPQQQRGDAPLGYYNLGVAHGVPGVIAFLAQIATLGLEKEVTDRASALLAGAVAWLLAQQRPPNSVCRYGSWIGVGQPSKDSRIAWCYGDLGIAGILWFVAHRVNNSSWIHEARSLTDHCLPRQSRIADATMCHGALGVAHIYNRIYQSTHEDSYRLALLDWTNRGMALRENGVGIAGYYHWTPDPNQHKSRDTSFLTGVVGIALALLSLIAPIEPGWDRRMLLSGVRLSAT